MTMKPTYKTKSNLYRKVSGKKGLSNSSSYQRGGTLPPIYTSNRNDPRLKAYNDSLYSYNITKKYEGKFPVVSNEITDKITRLKTTPNIFGHLPIGWYEIPSDNSDNDAPKFSAKYKKPVQPYIYKKPKVLPIYTSDLNDPRLVNYNNSVAKYDYYKNAYESDPNVKKRNLKYEDAIKGRNYGDKFYLENGKFSTEPIIVIKKPNESVLYADPEIVGKQKKLKEVGLYSGDLDGIWGKDSKKAWKKYEESLPTEKTSTTTTTTTPTTTAVKPPVITKPAIYTAPTPVQKKTTPQPSTDTPWRFMLGNDSYQTFDEETAKTFAKDLGITNLQRGDNKNIDPATKKYRDYSSLVTPGTTNTGTTGTITKYPKLKRMEYGGQIAKGSRLKKLYTAYKTRR